MSALERAVWAAAYAAYFIDQCTRLRDGAIGHYPDARERDFIGAEAADVANDAAAAIPPSALVEVIP